MINIEISQFPDSSWNKRLVNNEFSAYCQTVEVAKYVELRLKFQPKFIKFFTESDSIWEHIPQVIILLTLGGIIYFGIMYCIDNSTRNLYKSIINELKKK